MKLKMMAVIILCLCLIPVVTWAEGEVSPADLQPRTFQTPYGELKMRWSQDGIFVELAFDQGKVPSFSPGQGFFRINLLDKDGTIVSDDFYFGRAAVDDIREDGKGGMIYQGKFFCGAEAYPKITSVTVQVTGVEENW